MQPPPDAVGEFRVVTNNQSAEYGRAAGATVNVAYRSGTNQFHGDALGVLPRHRAERRRPTSSRPTAQKPPLRRNQYGGVLGGPIVQEQGVLLRRLRRVPPGPEGDGVLDAADRGAERRHPERRHPRSAHRRRLSGRHADSDDRVRAQGARRPAGAERAPAPPTTTRSLQEFTNDTDKAGGKIDLQVSPALSLFGRYGWRRSQHQRSAADSAAVRRRRQRQHLHAQQAARARHDLRRRAIDRCSRCASAGRTRRAARTRRRSATRRQLRHHRPADRRAHRRRPAVAGASPATPAFGRQATNPQWQYPTVWNPKVNYSWLMGTPVAQGRLRVPADQRRGAGRQPALRPRQLHRPVHPAGERRREQPLQPRRLHARPALAVRAQHVLRRATCGRTCTSPTCRTTSASTTS